MIPNCSKMIYDSTAANGDQFKCIQCTGNLYISVDYKSCLSSCNDFVESDLVHGNVTAPEIIPSEFYLY